MNISNPSLEGDVNNSFELELIMKLHELREPLHQEPGQKPGKPGKAWPGQAHWPFYQACLESATWESLASRATARLSRPPRQGKPGLPGHESLWYSQDQAFKATSAWKAWPSWP